METYQNIVDYLFRVYIYDRRGVLVIEDRRPTLGMFVSIVGLLGIAIFIAVSFVLARVGVDLDIWSSFGALAGLIATFVVLLLFSLGGTFREVYAFDKSNDSYHFTRRGIFKNEVIEGSASQFCGVRIDKRTADDDSVYMVVLLLGGMLLGQPGEQTLRDDPPIFNSYQKESQIAGAISTFLNTKPQDDLDP